jgi:hypothetical protein
MSKPDEFNDEFDDEIDEDFKDTKPVLSNDDIDKINTLLTTKTKSELLEYINKLSSFDNLNFQLQKGINMAYGNNSKKELITIIKGLINNKNKSVFFEETKQNEPQEKLSREELRKKLHDKMKMSDKRNLQKMYEKLQDEYLNNQETTETNNTSTDKKKKKKKKIDPEKLKKELINQMTEIVKNGGLTDMTSTTE